MVPSVSIIVATKNEHKNILGCIDAINKQKYPHDRMEIIIVDGCSTDDTVGVVKKAAGRFKLPMRILKNENIIQSSAWNIGISESCGAIILIVSAHSFIQTDYVQKCVSYLEKTGASNVGGPMIAVGEGYVGKIIEFVHHSFFGLGGGRFHDKDFQGYVDTVYLGAWRKELFDKIGLFDERLIRNQDIEFNARIRNNGGTIFLTREIKVYYHCRNTLDKLWTQNLENGKWIIYTKKIAPYCFSWRHFVPLSFVGTLTVSCLLWLIGGYFGFNRLSAVSCLVLNTAIISYALATLFFAGWLSFEKGLKYFVVLPVVFATLHFSYGLGSILGLITVNNWYNKEKGKPRWVVGDSAVRL